MGRVFPLQGNITHYVPLSDFFRPLFGYVFRSSRKEASTNRLFRRCGQDRNQVEVQLRVTHNKCHACGLFEQTGSCFTVGARSNCRFMGNVSPFTRFYTSQVVGYIEEPSTAGFPTVGKIDPKN